MNWTNHDVVEDHRFGIARPIEGSFRDPQTRMPVNEESGNCIAQDITNEGVRPYY